MSVSTISTIVNITSTKDESITSSDISNEAKAMHAEPRHAATFEMIRLMLSFSLRSINASTPTTRYIASTPSIMPSLYVTQDTVPRKTDIMMPERPIISNKIGLILDRKRTPAAHTSSSIYSGIWSIMWK